MKRSIIKGLMAVAITFGMLSTTSVKAKDREKNIVETAVAAGTFNTLAAALQAAGLVDVLQSEGPFTVFAPTDEAFAKLPEGTVAALLKDKEKLTQILLYHVVAGKVMVKDIVKLNAAKTVQGQSIKIMVKDGKVMADGARLWPPIS
jgi:transforming growth factor-beta-induced protein